MFGAEASITMPGANRKHLLVPILGLLAALALLGAGCGGDDDPTTTTRSPQEQEEAQQERRETIERFGLEATGGEAQQAESAVRGYLGALQNEEWKKACSYLPKQLRKLYGRFSSDQSGGQKKSEGCAASVEMTTRRLSAAEQDDLAKANITSVRIEDDRGYVLYTNTGGEAYAMSITREGKQWKVSGGVGTPLS